MYLHPIPPDFELQNNTKDSVVTVQVSGPFIAGDEFPGIHYFIVIQYMFKMSSVTTV